MGVTAAQKAMQILENTEYIIAIELLCAAQAIEFRKSEKLGKGTVKAYTTIRKTVPMLKQDRALSEDIEKIRKTVKERVILDEIEKSSKIQ
jgi:histidine ammonia-lyase